MRELSFYPREQFALVRILLGLLFFFQFTAILPYGAELFSSSGWLTAQVAPIPFMAGPLLIANSPAFVTAYLAFLAAASLFLAAGIAYRAAALLVWLGLVSLLARNRLYHDIDLDYLGWLALAVALVPAFGARASFRMPPLLYWGAWLVLGLSYSVSGASKCLSPVWRGGLAISYVLDSSLARFAFLAELARGHAWLAAASTWLVLGVETLFLPLILFPRTRFYAWAAMAVFHAGIGITTQLTGLSVAALLFHLFVFDRRWLNQLRFFAGSNNMSL